MAALAPAGELAPVRSSAPATLWTPRGTALGVYVHVPFCASRCGYCSFNTAPYREAAVPRYLAALGREIDLAGAAPWSVSAAVSTVFFGGGTPSLLTPSELGAILERLRTRFRVVPDAEITVECNPDSASRERLSGYRDSGVNRISLGVQSLDDQVLAALDRAHSAAQARAAFDAARRAGFDNVSADLIYGLPGLDAATWERTVRSLLDWGPEHLSAYALTLDEGSRWHAAGSIGLPAEESVAEQYRELARLAAAAGFEHYEISNYARAGRRSAHNQIYWRGQEYLALGPGACGFLGDTRYGNVKATERYCATLEAGALPVASQETLTARLRLAERLILGLRLGDGIPEAWLAERVALEPGRLPTLLETWRERGLLVSAHGRLRLSEAGFLLSDALFVELL
ncbi:MAG: radical SAM family heme chaperone HemW [Candidatus Rokubacteria bacterium]|nr:radical SAM family heme chaperone HemW [Candidatus Rokubacteria bacterium]